MENLLLQAIVQGGGTYWSHWGSLCSYWQWGFWLAFIVGAVGAGILLLKNSGMET